MTSEVDRVIARLRFRHLQLIAEIERTGSLRAAADTLHLTQPALSKALKELEAMLGFPLFVRTLRGLERTAQGEVLIRGARLLMEELRYVRAEADAAGPEGRAAAQLRIGAPPFIAMHVLPKVLRKLIMRDPPVLVKLREDRAPALLDAVIAGELDALVTVYAPEAASASAREALRYEKLADEEYVVIAPPQHALARLRRAAWSELAREAWVMTRSSSMTRVVLEQCFVRAGVMPPAPVIESDSPVTNVRLAAEGIGLSAVTASTMREAESAGAVKRIRPDPPIPATAYGLLYRAARAAHPRIALLREALNLR